MEFDIEKCAKLIRKSGKREKNVRDRTTKSRKTHNARRNGKLQGLGNIESGHHQTSRD